MLQPFMQRVSRFLPDALAMWPVEVVLESGVKVLIDSQLTLQMFVELFVTQPYLPALNLLPKPEVVVDLGANRGLFVLFVSHCLRLRGESVPRFICVEAAKPNLKCLAHHVQANSLGDQVTLVHGAVCGKRSGTVQFYYAPRAHGMARLVEGGRLTTRGVHVVDLAAFVRSSKIDLLKVDIEGTEEEFLQEYPEILEKTRVLIGEFHLQQINYARCQAMLGKAGLAFHSRTFQFEDKLAVDVFARWA